MSPPTALNAIIDDGFALLRSSPSDKVVLVERGDETFVVPFVLAHFTTKVSSPRSTSTTLSLGLLLKRAKPSSMMASKAVGGDIASLSCCDTQ
ncbi:hypothetical protein WJX75_001708 [Coccomyxa subellipsoidea]|uniref:Uncharacterized protein n=1 Tax=Coccomyxa subellipsoidea TaxID=248742 RepID=A0ABR2Z2K3_9CHLO